MLQKQFACARLSRPCLPESSSRLFGNVHHHRLYGVFIIQRFQSGDLFFLLSCFLAFLIRVFLCSIWNPVSSSRPAASQKPTRAGAVKVGRRTNLSTPSARGQAIP